MLLALEATVKACLNGECERDSKVSPDDAGVYPNLQQLNKMCKQYVFKTNGKSGKTVTLNDLDNLLIGIRLEHIKQKKHLSRGSKNVKRLKKMNERIQKGEISVDPIVYMPNF